MKRVVSLLIPALMLLMSPVVIAQDTTTTVAVAESADLGSYLTDSEGMTLYLFTKDDPETAESVCYDDCAIAWPPYLVEADAELTLPEGVPGTLGTTERKDGTMQVTYNGWPLYYWVDDKAPGDTTGEGVGDVWYVIAPGETTEAPGASPEASPEASPAAVGDTTVLVGNTAELGDFLTDSEGMTLYLFTNDTEGVSNCYDQCAENWPPFVAEEPLTLPEGVTGELTLIDRTDGTQQVAYNGTPLYYYVDDTAPGDTTGQEKGDVWYVVPPES
jgi:predicted lipoprotein with Yx(FWY)xxD motif